VLLFSEGQPRFKNTSSDPSTLHLNYYCCDGFIKKEKKKSSN